MDLHTDVSLDDPKLMDIIKSLGEGGRSEDFGLDPDMDPILLHCVPAPAVMDIDGVTLPGLQDALDSGHGSSDGESCDWGGDSSPGQEGAEGGGGRRPSTTDSEGCCDSGCDAVASPDSQSEQPETGETSTAAASTSEQSEEQSEGMQTRTRGQYNLRATSIVNRVQTERRYVAPKEPKPKPKPKAPSLSKYRRKTANTRERTRMQEINDSYEVLRLAIPNFPKTNGKLTKITTLRLALNYICALREMLGYEDEYATEPGPQSAETVVTAPPVLPPTPDTPPPVPMDTTPQCELPFAAAMVAPHPAEVHPLPEFLVEHSLECDTDSLTFS